MELYPRKGDHRIIITNGGIVMYRAHQDFMITVKNRVKSPFITGYICWIRFSSVTPTVSGIEVEHCAANRTIPDKDVGCIAPIFKSS